ncbi:MAG: hypothetical protein NZ805_11700, partial [Armatimonadetes bacterium]|nr:hypothetical protein [Armatimonadota bacterium]
GEGGIANEHERGREDNGFNFCSKVARDGEGKSKEDSEPCLVAPMSDGSGSRKGKREIKGGIFYF